MILKATDEYICLSHILMNVSCCILTQEEIQISKNINLVKKGQSCPWCELAVCVHSYISALLHQPRQSFHQVCDKDDVHDVSEVRRPAGEGH